MVDMKKKKPEHPPHAVRAMPDDAKLRLLSTLINSLPDNIYFKDCDGHFTLVNLAMATYFGFQNPSDVEGRTDFDFFSDEHARAARRDETEVMRTGKPILNKEEKETWPGRSGDTWVATTKMPLYDEKGAPLGTFGVSRDITTRKAAEEAVRAHEAELSTYRHHLEDLISERTGELERANAKLHEEVAERRRTQEKLSESEQRYRLLLEGLPTYVYSVVVEGKRVVSTQHGAGCARVTGYTPDDYDADPELWITMVFHEDRDMVRDFASRGAGPRSQSIEHRLIHKDGQLRWVRNTIVHHYRPSGELAHYDGLVEDITERKRMEDARREGEKTRAVSDLATGVAHSFNTLISAITGSAASISDNLLPNTRGHDDALRIIGAARHAGDLTKRLLAMARSMDLGPDADVSPVSLQQVAEEATGLLQRPFSEQGVTIHIRDGASLPWVHANEVQLLDALMSILINAAEAMPGGGTITIWATKRRLTQPALRWNPTSRAGPYAILRIADTGIGMEPELLSHIFEPFRPGHGDKPDFGLALPLAQQMVKRWGGWIGVRSRVGAGTTMRLCIPQADGPATTTPDEPSFEGGTVLLLDDDRELLETMRETVEGRGFTALTADSAVDGVALYKEHAAKVDVAVIDMVMPGSDCRYALEQILSHEAQANIIVTSGFSRDYTRSQLNLGAWRFIQKPFEPAQLIAALEKTLTAAET